MSDSKIKVLLISYYWPPAAGGGVHRWLKFSKYLDKTKVDLTVYTPSNPEYPAVDEKSLDQIPKDIKVIKKKIFEVYSLYKMFTGKKKDEKIYSGFINEQNSIKQKISVWIRGNFFIPDARKFWIKPSIKFLCQLQKEQGFDVIISTGPPHSMHLIALGIKEKYPTIKWISDFRDPWTKIDFYDKLNLSKRSDALHKKLERKVLMKSDQVVTISNTCAKDLASLSNNREISVITNGFDPEDFDFEVSLDSSFTISHIGSMNEDRSPIELIESLSDLITDGHPLVDEIKIQLIGQVDGVIKDTVEKLGVQSYVSYIPFMDHKDVIKVMKSSKVLLLVINRTPDAAGILTGKAFEYIGANRPILTIGPKEGDMKEILQGVKHSKYIDFGDKAACKIALVDFYNNYQKNNNVIEKNDLFENFSRQTLAERYLKLIDH